MKKKSKFKIKAITAYLKKHNIPIQTILNLLMLLLSIAAIIISLFVFNSSNKQFDENSKKSDSLFKIQLMYEKLFNDSIIFNLRKIQSQTDKQISIIDQQLSMSAQLFNDQVNSGVPKFIFYYIELKDRDVMINGVNAPEIFTKFKNVGNRFAVNVKIRSFAVSNDLKEVRYNDNSESSGPVGSDAVVESSFFPKFTKYKVPFYFCIEISYSDILTRKSFIHIFYKEYNKLRTINDFFDCDKQFIPQMRSTINNFLKQNKMKSI